ncbi:MAG: paraquat-inducible protein A [Methylococcus sp.]
MLACHDCDSLYPRPRLKPGQKARCTRCGAVLLENKPNGIERCLALNLANVVLLILANVFPLMTMNIQGRVQEANVVSGVIELYRQGFGAMAAVVLMVSVLAPALKILCTLYVLAPLRFNRALPYATRIFRTVANLSPWSMTEVFMLGILVALVKLADLARLAPGLAMFSFIALIVTMAAADSVLEPDEVWQRLDPRS